MKQEELNQNAVASQSSLDNLHENDKELLKKIALLSDSVSKSIEKYDFNKASSDLYHFIWHTFADIYIEDVKNRIDANSLNILRSQFLVLLLLLHPIMPFITEEISARLGLTEKMLIVEDWPFSGK